MSSLAYSQWVLVHYHSVEDRSSNNKVKEPQNTYMGRCLQLELSSFPELQWNCGRDYWWKGHLILLWIFFSFLNCSVKMKSSVCCTKEAESLIPRPLRFNTRKSCSHVPCISWVSIRLETCGLHGANEYFIEKYVFSGWLDALKLLPWPSSLGGGGWCTEGDGLWARDPAVNPVWLRAQGGRPCVHLSSSSTIFWRRVSDPDCAVALA